jgi:hypothetical protein
MRERHFYFVVVSILFFNVEIFSQIKPECIKLPINHNPPANRKFENSLQLDRPLADMAFFPGKIKGDPVMIKPHPSSFVLSPSFYSNHLSFFCNKELQLDKVTPVPFRFRIGSLDYVNYLERKPNARKLQP